MGNDENPIMLAIDPGKTTGYCGAYKTDGKLYLAVCQKQHEEIELWHVLKTMASKGDLHVICETFEFRNAARTGLDFTPARLIGIVNLASQMFGFPVYMQNPVCKSEKGYFSNERMKELGVWKVACDHGRDATKHLLHWVKFLKGFEVVGLPIDLVMLDTDEPYPFA